MKIVIESTESDIEVKKSRFIGELKNVRSEDEAKAFLEDVSRKHREARHHCFAIRLGMTGKEFERFSDDGEPQGTAGKPILSLLQGAGLSDVCGVVTRYFGGTLLGTGGLVKAYSDSMKSAISLAKTAELKNGFRFTFLSDYPTSNRIRYLAGTLGIFTAQEEYTDVCRFTYILEKERFEDFTGRVREMSSGRINPENLEELLYYEENGKPNVYKAVSL